MEIEVIWCAAWKSWPLFDNSTSNVLCVIWCYGPILHRLKVWWK